ncbi:MAG: flagellar hook-associated protein FlgK [Burkholderiaceae bacterium]|nr:flagellar hook-associated protein FlgK [Burkholderiaceae bacterium]
MSIGTTALYAAYAQLQTTGNNIANANTPGFSRQSVQLATAGGASFGAGYFGRGVTVATVTRASNMFLTQQAVGAGAAAAADGVRRDMLSQLEQVFPGGEAGLGRAANQIFNAAADVAAAPADLAARQAMLGRLEDFASLARNASNQIESLQANLMHDVSGGIAEVNTIAAELAKLNGAIAAATRRGQAPNDLLDQRDELVRRIGQQVEVHTVRGPDETVSVFVGSGQTLVLGLSSNRLLVQADPQDSSRITVGVDNGGQITSLSAETVGGGQIGGLLRFQNDDLAEARNRLGLLVAGLAGALNEQQSFGLDLQGQPGATLLAFSGPKVLPASANARDANGNFISGVGLAISDPALLKASDYRLETDPANAGQYIVTRLADGQVFQPVLDGDSLDGFTITIGPGVPAAGESFTLKPVAAAAGDLTVLLKNPRALAAANPVLATVDPANTGTASVAALAITAAPAGPYQALTLRFSDDGGSYELLDGNNVVGTGVHLAGQPIRLDGIELTLSGIPRAGDRLAIVPTPLPAASNGNALRFESLSSRLLVDGQTATDAYAATMAEVGVRVQGAVAAADTSATVASRAQAELSAEIGVNLDEEAARLLQFQQSYQAAAKLLQTSQSLFDTLINNLGR